MIEYENISRAIGLVVSRNKATLKELQTFYGAEDLRNLIEICIVDSHNERILSEPRN